MQACVSLSNKLKFITICFHGIIHQSFVHVCSIFFEVKENVFQIHAMRTKAVVVSKIVNFTFCWEKDQTQVFPLNFAKLLRTTFLQNTSGRLFLQKEMTIKFWCTFYELIPDFSFLLWGTNNKIGVLIISFVKIFTNRKKTKTW